MLNYQRVGALKVSDGRNPSNHCGFLRSNIAGRPVGLILIMYSWFFISPKYTYGKVMEKHTYNIYIYIYLFMYVYIYIHIMHTIYHVRSYTVPYIYIPISTYLLCMYMFDLYYISTYLYSVYIYTYIYIWL